MLTGTITATTGKSGVLHKTWFAFFLCFYTPQYGVVFTFTPPDLTLFAFIFALSRKPVRFRREYRGSASRSQAEGEAVVAQR